MPSIGHIQAYDSKSETFTAWKARLCQYFLANDIKEERHVAALIATIGSQGYKTLQDIFAPGEPCTKTFQELCDALEQHHSPKPLQLAERFRLHKCTQGDTETVTEYIATLRSLSLNCGYDNAVLSDTLRDIFIVGLRSQHIQRELISKPDTLTFTEARATAKKLEAASTEVSKLSGKRSSQLHKVFTRKGGKQQHQRNTPTQPEHTDRPCFRCTGKHAPDACSHRDSTCNYCKKAGHIERACIKKAKDTGVKPKVPLATPKPPRGARHQKRVHHVTDTAFQEYSDDDYIQCLHTAPISDTKQDKFCVTPTVNKIPVNFEIDTGAGVSVMPYEQFKQLFPHATLKPTDRVLRSYTNDVINTHGIYTCDVKIHGQKKRVNLYITSTGTTPLFGRSWIRSFKLKWDRIQAVRTATQIHSTTDAHQSTHTSLKDITQRYSSVFEPGSVILRTRMRNFSFATAHAPSLLALETCHIPYAIKLMLNSIDSKKRASSHPSHTATGHLQSVAYRNPTEG